MVKKLARDARTGQFSSPSLHKTYVIDGPPIALARPRMNGMRIYDSQKKEKLLWGIELKDQHGDADLFKGPLHLSVVFFMPIPESYTIDKKMKVAGHSHVFKPDLDNFIKWVCDVATGILFADDCIIAKITATKIYHLEARTEFTIEKAE
jgi:Holliday junction resolvase RusA-like endonuclease